MHASSAFTPHSTLRCSSFAGQGTPCLQERAVARAFDRRARHTHVGRLSVPHHVRSRSRFTKQIGKPQHRVTRIHAPRAASARTRAP